MPKTKFKPVEEDKEKKDPTYDPKRRGGHSNSSNLFGRVATDVKHVAVRLTANPNLTPKSQKAHQAKTTKDIQKKLGPVLREDAKTPPPKEATSSTPLTPAETLITNSGRRLQKVRKYAHLRVYAETPIEVATKPATARVLNYDEANVVAKVLSPKTKIKKRRYTSNKKERAARKLFPPRRYPSQKQVAGNVTANDYAQATHHPEELVKFDIRLQKTIQQKWEWTHFVAYSQEGPDAQKMANLVCATEEFNTCMMFLEKLDRYLEKMYKTSDYTKEVSGTLATVSIGQNRITTHNLVGGLEWKIITPDFTETVFLDLKYQHIKPSKAEADIVDIVFKDLFERVKTRVQALHQPSVTHKKP